MKMISNSKVLTQFFSQLHELFFIIDCEGKIHETNQNFFLSKNLQLLLHNKDWVKVKRVLENRLSENLTSIELELELKMPEGSIWFLCKIGNIDESPKDEPLFLLAFQNIQKQKDREETLIKEKEHAEAQEKIKSSFLSNMSHEIRTPMNSIIGFAELLKSASTDSEREQYLDIIKGSGIHLLNIINDIIDISKIESGILNIKVQRININNLIDELCDIYQSDNRLNSGEVEILSSKPLADTDAFILTDGTRIRQILSNLFDNAVKFTAKGSIEIGYKILGSKLTQQVPVILFYVKDTGQGIPKSEQRLIFYRFHQVREGDESKGSGLGLAIVDALVKKLGGSISVKSAIGIGSEFMFSIPFLQRKSVMIDEDKKKEQNIKPDLKGRHILIAEDVPANFMFISAVLRGTHAKLTWAKNGKEAVEAVLSGEKFDMILMDLRMPIMDGYKASGHIKTIDSKLPILALTAFAVEGDLEKALEAGCDDYLSKPISIPSLYKKLNFFLNM